MTETRTDLVIQAKAKGFQDAQQQASNVIKAAAKATQDQIKGFAALGKNSQAYKKEIQGLEKSLKTLTIQQLAATKALEGVAKGSKIYEQLQKHLAGVNKEYSQLASQKQKIQELFGPQGQPPLSARDMSRGGFTQGLVQGAFNTNLQRGPGMWRQAAGMSVGTMARGFAGAPFGGVQGFTQGLAGIPIAGGAAAGQFSNVVGFAEGALGLQQAKLGAIPFLGRNGGMSGAGKERDRAIAAATKTTKQPISEASIEAAIQERMPGILARGAQAGDFDFDTGRGSRLASKEIEKTKREMARKEAMSSLDLTETVTTTDNKAVRAAKSAYQKALNKPFAGIREAGARFGGMSEQEALQAFLPALQKAGGGIDTAQNQNAIGATFAAQTRYGVGADVSGSFLGGRRRGGSIGGGANAGEDIAKTIGDALSLGLEGSEVSEYLAQMAQHMDEWKTTGIPLNLKSMADLSKSFSGMGFGGQRGAVLGQQFAGAAQNLTMSGVQDPMDLMMLQTVGGYQGGGMGKYLDAMEKLESLGGGKGIGNKEVNSMISQISKAGGGGDAGAWTVREAFGKKGIRMGVAESRLAVKASTDPDSLNAGERAKLAGINAKMKAGEEGAPGDAAGLAQQAREAIKAYAPAVKKAAELQNKQNDIGDKFLGSVQKLQESAQNINTAFSTLASGGIKDATSAILNFTGAIDRAFAGNL